MKNKFSNTNQLSDKDPTAVSRKQDHIQLAFDSQVEKVQIDSRFYYEPMLSAHPKEGDLKPFSFLGKKLKVPIWVSSMTGGTELAGVINRNLAKACNEFGMGMGLGSCRALLYSDDMLSDFDMRGIIGDELPLYANLGIAQLEKLIKENELFLVDQLLKKLKADGLIIHVNPLQEWLQPEGDRIEKAPIDTIRTLLDHAGFPVIVKEVGQGIGYESLKALFQLPVEAIDFAANGGTNFSKLELLRSDPKKKEIFGQLALVGHTAEDMIDIATQVINELGTARRCNQVIISGGIRNFLDGYYVINKLPLSSVYGQATGFLKHARGSYEDLKVYVEAQIQGLRLANAYLKLR